jgi:hypothetical protein
VQGLRHAAGHPNENEWRISENGRDFFGWSEDITAAVFVSPDVFSEEQGKIFQSNGCWSGIRLGSLTLAIILSRRRASIRQIPA